MSETQRVWEIRKDPNYKFGKILDRKETAGYLKISMVKLAQLDIPKINIGRRVIYRKLDIDKWLERQLLNQTEGCVV